MLFLILWHCRHHHRPQPTKTKHFLQLFRKRSINYIFSLFLKILKIMEHKRVIEYVKGKKHIFTWMTCAHFYATRNYISIYKSILQSVFCLLLLNHNNGSCEWNIIVLFCISFSSVRSTNKYSIKYCLHCKVTLFCLF